MYLSSTLDKDDKSIMQKKIDAGMSVVVVECSSCLNCLVPRSYDVENLLGLSGLFVFVSV